MTVLEPLPVPAARNSAHQIADLLRERVLHRGDGEPLGTEDELVTELGVSRPTFRQALRILQAEGLVRVKRGPNGGLFAQLPNVDALARSASMLLRRNGTTFDDLIGAILPLSAEMARLAAAHPNARARRRVAEAIVAFEASEELPERQRVLEAGHAFGAEVAKVAHNPAVTMCIQLLSALVGAPEDSPDATGHYAETRRFHRDVAAAIARGDQEEASRLCRDMQGALLRWDGPARRRRRNASRKA